MEECKTMKCYVRRRRKGLKVEEEEEEEDRLSSLPDAIITDILSRLSTKTAASTSVLSHRWRTLWTNITHICLQLPTNANKCNDFAVIDHILRQITSPKLVSFSLDLELFHPSNYPKFCSIESWFRQVCSCKPEEIAVFEGQDPEFRIPPCLFNCQSLVTLYLQGELYFEYPKNNKGFQLPNLKELTLDFLYEVPIWLEALISSSPLLERLYLGFDLEDLQQPCSAITIVAPNLKSLEIRKEFPFKTPRTRICIDAPQLENLDIHDCTSIYYFCNHPTSLVKARMELTSECYDTDISGGNYYYLQEISKFVAGLSNLTLRVGADTNIFPYLNSMNLPMFSNLVFLETNCLNGLMPSLQSFPNLEHLVVNLSQLMELMNWQLPYSIPDCLTNKLKTIEINYLLVLQDEVTLVAYILKSAMVLKRLQIRMDSHYVKDEQEKGYAMWKECQFFKSLFKLPRSSTTCELVVLGDNVRASGDALQDGYLTFKMDVGK